MKRQNFSSIQKGKISLQWYQCIIARFLHNFYPNMVLQVRNLWTSFFHVDPSINLMISEIPLYIVLAVLHKYSMGKICCQVASSDISLILYTYWEWCLKENVSELFSMS